MKTSGKILANLLLDKLESAGYQLSVNGLIRQCEGVCSVIEFTRNKHRSASGYPSFAIDIGISINLIRAFEGYDSIIPVTVQECHWIERLMKAENSDQFWIVATDASSIEMAIQTVADLVATMEVFSRPPQDFVVSNWQKLSSPGITEYQRVKYLSIVLSQKNDPLGNVYLDMLKDMDRKMGINDAVLYDKINSL